MAKNFKFMNKEGSIFIEASFVMPLTIVIAIMMLQLSIVFFTDFAQQVSEHKAELQEKSYVLQMELVRNHEKIIE